MTRPPAFQFYAKDWTSSTVSLSLAAKGTHISLLAWSWDNGPVPLDLDAIARIVGANPNQFSSVWDEVKSRWNTTNGGRVNARLESERRKQRSFRRLQAAKGRAGAEARLSRGSTAGPTEHPTERKPSSSLSSSSSSSTSIATTPTGKETRLTARADGDQRFDLFWTAYPNKKAKIQARKAFEGLSPSEDLLGRILSAISEQARSDQWTKDRGAFIPYPASWLNAKRWEDEPAAPLPSRQLTKGGKGNASRDAGQRAIQRMIDRGEVKT